MTPTYAIQPLPARAHGAPNEDGTITVMVANAAGNLRPVRLPAEFATEVRTLPTLDNHGGDDS